MNPAAMTAFRLLHRNRSIRSLQNHTPLSSISAGMMVNAGLITRFDTGRVGQLFASPQSSAAPPFPVFKGQGRARRGQGRHKTMD
jgi:hypothetical protein